MSQRTTTSPAAPQPPAPGAEQYPALDFANSLLTLPAGPLDLLGSPETATDWLIGHGLAPADGRIHQQCTDRLHGLRTAVRELFAARTAELPPPPTPWPS
ncbi:ABATE domain-containing protein [Kitasatospora cheerisanensis]|uniref:Uncharacterized protein n=1 Tax=Kitasatospora cheerisanensis KCTC 2395 TaxID=1348663 RepID=A0A066YQ94_9ACTN|nr:hypothetical protein KCH_61040 [Kitasatospora cheerisanensis KCTC 2395]